MDLCVLSMDSVYNVRHLILHMSLHEFLILLKYETINKETSCPSLRPIVELNYSSKVIYQ